MAYSTSNPPRLASVSPLTGAGQHWVYRSTDPIASVDASGYFTNAHDLGMRAGDLVTVMDTALSIISMSQVMTVTASSAADLGTGTLIGSSANAD